MQRGRPGHEPAKTHFADQCGTVQELQQEAEQAHSSGEAGGAAATPTPAARAYAQARRMVLLDAARTDLSACAAPEAHARPARSGQAAFSADACAPPTDASSTPSMASNSRPPSDLGEHAAPAEAAGVLSAPAGRRTSADLRATAAALRSISKPAGSAAAGGADAAHDAGAGPGGPGSAAGCAGAHAASSPLQGRSGGQGPGSSHTGAPYAGAARDAGAGPAMNSGGSGEPSSAAAAAPDPPGGGPMVQQQAESQAALRARLVTLLCAYAAHDPDTGYCQGRVPFSD